MSKFKFVKAYLYKRMSSLTKTNVWVLSTKKQTSVKFKGLEIVGASSNTFKPGSQSVGSTDISTVWLNIEEDSEQESIVHDMVEENGGSSEFVLQLDKASGQTSSVLTQQEYEELLEKEDDSTYEEQEQVQAD